MNFPKLITHLTKRVVDLDGVETSEELHFFYDAHSKPAFVEYGGIKYCYIHNLQGDIVAIVDATGNIVVEYEFRGEMHSYGTWIYAPRNQADIDRYAQLVCEEILQMVPLVNRVCACFLPFPGTVGEKKS